MTKKMLDGNGDFNKIFFKIVKTTSILFDKVSTK